ncbi:MAG: S8 family serine peptidase [Acidimicrobiia bacterium]|nr:S8 family serine peptidase [Acidimicrobiia bacterium]
MADHKARRRIVAVLAALGAGAVGILVRRKGRPTKPPWGPAGTADSGLPEERPTAERPAAEQDVTDGDGRNVRVTLVRDGEVVRGAKAVELVAGAERAQLEPAPDGSYRARVAPGTYRVEARIDGGLRLVPVSITARAEPAAWTFAVVAPDEPYLRVGSEVLAIRPRLDLFVVASPRPLEPERAQRLAGAARQELGLELVDHDRLQPTERPAASGFIVLRDDPKRGWADRERAEGLRRVAATAGFDGDDLRIGFIVDAGERGRPMVDRRYLVRLGRDATGQSGPRAEARVPDEVRKLFDGIDADVLRPLPEPDAYVVEFRDRDFRRHLRVVESYVAEGVFRYGEPSLVSPVVDLVDLGLYLAQYQGAPQPASVPLQRMEAPDAWAALVAAGTAGVPGTFATVDRGVVAASPFLAGVDVELRDWQGAVVGGHAATTPAPLHGMQVFGVASGNGHQGVWGVAPNLRHVAVQRSDTFGPEVFWDPFDELVASGVRIVSLSFKPNFTGWDSHSEWRVNSLVDAGMLIVVAAGNDRSRLRNVDGSQSTRLDATSNGITITWVDFPLAAHPRTLTVGSTQLGADGEEQYWDFGSGRGTNRGDALDLCALATNYLTCLDDVNAAPAEGTSLAAPLVAATAAAVRALRPAATVAQVKALLCSSARRIRAGEPFWLALGAPADWDPTVPVPAHHLRYGYGQLDVAEAIARANLLP